LAILNIESQLTHQLNYSDIIEDFANNQARKKNIKTKENCMFYCYNLLIKKKMYFYYVDLGISKVRNGVLFGVLYIG